MKLIERLGRNRRLKVDRYDKLRNESLDPNSTGWVIDPVNPNKLFVAGAPATFGQVWGYELATLEQKYKLLKRQLHARYPDFSPKRNMLLQVEVHYAGKIMADPELRANLKPWGFSRVQYVHTKVQMDGDTVELRIAPGGYYEGYGFFVYGHPEGYDPKHSGPDSGVWCRPTPDDLALLANERTV
jgi:hypothetical protein